MELMKQRFCFENNYQTGNFEETTLFTVGRRIYVCIRRGPQLKKRPAKKEKKKKDEKRAETPFHSHMNRRNVSYVQGAKC